MLDPEGLDLSRSQFIELWVNDFKDQALVRDRHVMLHVDLGAMSEDRMPSPDQPPNGRLDTEDRIGDDNVLVLEEDTGLDGLVNPDSNRTVDLVTSGVSTLNGDHSGDPGGDDFYPPNEIVTREPAKAIDPRYWVSVNGAEKNSTINPVPDTEDQNLNGALDVKSNYLEYSIDLGDVSPEAPYLVTDVNNGWRRYRIPIAGSGAVKFGNPNLASWSRTGRAPAWTRPSCTGRCSCWAGWRSWAAAGSRPRSTRSRWKRRSRR
jgi:cell surface protein SprA